MLVVHGSRVNCFDGHFYFSDLLSREGRSLML